jgi:hypothetical protein
MFVKELNEKLQQLPEDALIGIKTIDETDKVRGSKNIIIEPYCDDIEVGFSTCDYYIY